MIFLDRLQSCPNFADLGLLVSLTLNPEARFGGQLHKDDRIEINLKVLENHIKEILDLIALPNRLNGGKLSHGVAELVPVSNQRCQDSEGRSIGRILLISQKSKITCC